MTTLCRDYITHFLQQEQKIIDLTCVDQSLVLFRNFAVIDLNVLSVISSFWDVRGWKLPKIVRISGSSKIEILINLGEL